MRFRTGFLLASAALLGAVALWLMLAGPPPRIPPGWSWQSSFVGISADPDPETGEFPQKSPLGIYERAITIESDAGRPESIIMRDDLIIRDPITREVTWRYTAHPTVDPATGQHLGPEGQGDFLVMPRGAERRTYPFRMNYIKRIPLTFVSDERVEGLHVYMFAYNGHAEYTESYAGTLDYPGVPVEPGQEIRCADDQFSFHLWVEPTTGETVKIAERCDAGDYIFDTATGERLDPILRWGGETTGIDVLRRVDWVRGERRRLLVRKYLPLTFAAGAVALAGVGIFLRRTQS